MQNTPVWSLLCNYCATEGYNDLKYADFFARHDVSNPYSEGIRSLADRFRVIRASELKKYRIYHQIRRFYSRMDWIRHSNKKNLAWRQKLADCGQRATAIHLAGQLHGNRNPSHKASDPIALLTIENFN
jgi:hypothetical protein